MELKLFNHSGLSRRTIKVLKKNRIIFVEDLFRLTKNDMEMLCGISKIELFEIEVFMVYHDYKFNTEGFVVSKLLSPDSVIKYRKFSGLIGDRIEAYDMAKNIYQADVKKSRLFNWGKRAIGKAIVSGLLAMLAVFMFLKTNTELATVVIIFILLIVSYKLYASYTSGLLYEIYVNEAKLLKENAKLRKENENSSKNNK
jgi:hypothetical protein